MYIQSMYIKRVVNEDFSIIKISVRYDSFKTTIDADYSLEDFLYLLNGSNGVYSISKITNFLECDYTKVSKFDEDILLFRHSNKKAMRFVDRLYKGVYNLSAKDMIDFKEEGK